MDVTLHVPITLDEAERRLIVATLEHTRGNKKEAAQLLGTSRSALYAKMHRFGLVAAPCSICKGFGHTAQDHDKTQLPAGASAPGSLFLSPPSPPTGSVTPAPPGAAPRGDA